MFPINCLIITSQWLSSVSATPGVIMRIIDTNGIINPRQLFNAAGAGGPGPGTMLNPLVGGGDLTPVIGSWPRLVRPALVLEAHLLTAGVGILSMSGLIINGSGRFACWMGYIAFI